MKDIDFYVVSPHGAGMQSFLYYINFLGIPSSHWRWHMNQRCIKKNNYPLKKSERRYYYGLTVDRKLDKRVSYGNKKQNIFWLMRDPVELITSHINHGIGNQIYPFDVHNGLYGLNDKTFDRILSYRTALLYSSQLQTVESAGNIFPVDTAELKSDRVCDTLQRVSLFMGVKMPSGLDSIVKIPYNAYQNRVYRYPSWINLNTPMDNGRGVFEKSVLSYLKENVFVKLLRSYNKLRAKILKKSRSPVRFGRLSFCKAELYDFYFNQWKRHFVVGEKNFNNTLYTIFCNTPYAPQLDEEVYDVITRYIYYYSKCISYMLEIWNDKKISCEDVVTYLHDNTKFYDRLMFLLDKELISVQKIAADKMQYWQFYHKLCRV